MSAGLFLVAYFGGCGVHKPLADGVPGVVGCGMRGVLPGGESGLPGPILVVRDLGNESWDEEVSFRESRPDIVAQRTFSNVYRPTTYVGSPTPVWVGALVFQMCDAAVLMVPV